MLPYMDKTTSEELSILGRVEGPNLHEYAKHAVLGKKYHNHMVADTNMKTKSFHMIFSRIMLLTQYLSRPCLLH